MRAFDTPLGPARLEVMPARSRAPRQSRVKTRLLLDALLVAVVFGFVASTLLFGSPSAPPPAAAVSAGVR